jgi:hypothetical protein
MMAKDYIPDNDAKFNVSAVYDKMWRSEAERLRGQSESWNGAQRNDLAVTEAEGP